LELSNLIKLLLPSGIDKYLSFNSNILKQGDAMLFGEEKDWKEYLCGNAQVELAELIERAKQHKCAYMQADDVKVAQVWCALTELSRQMKELSERVERTEVALKGLAELGEVAKRESLRDRLGELLKAKSKDEKERVERIVDVLMEF